MSQNTETQNIDAKQLEIQQQNKKMENIIKQIDGLIKEPQNADKISPLLSLDLKNTLKNQKDTVTTLIAGARNSLNTQLDNADKKSLEDLVSFLEPIEKTQALQSIEIKNDKVSGYNSKQGLGEIQKAKDAIEQHTFNGKEIILNALGHPSKDTIIALQKFLYLNIEDQTTKLNLKNSSVDKKGNWDGGFGKNTSDAVIKFVQEIESDTTKADNIVTQNTDKIETTSVEHAVDGKIQTEDMINGTKLLITSIGEGGLLKSRSADIRFNKGFSLICNGNYTDGKISGGSFSFSMENKQDFIKRKANFPIDNNSQIDESTNTLTIKVSTQEEISDLEKILKSDNKGSLLEFANMMAAALNGNLVDYVSEKIHTKEPLSKGVGIMVNDIEYYPIETSDQNPLKLTTPEKGVALDNISGTGKIRVTTPQGVKIIQFTDGKITS